MIGRIVKGVGGRYDILTKDGLFNSTARGIFRKDDIKPMVGDLVEISVKDDGEGHLEKIYERKTELIRPPVANITMNVLTISSKKPNPNLVLLDKMIINTEIQDIKVLICINKKDLNLKRAREIEEIYKLAGYGVYLTDGLTGEGIEELKSALHGQIVSFSGPSGVGKSSIINGLFDKDLFETGKVSQKTQRGRHTTRAVELVPLDDETMILDTPGYTSMTVDLDPADLKEYFIEFNRFNKCYFSDCAHIAEPDCNVREAVERGEISSSRYENYKYILNELESERRY
ncbi:MAG: ribosome small subunit-dependent GTPase A [Tissierellia bacterium]|nr:ribosome small subunit-dependent GTPase A [Tissierellia bacterium]